DTESDSNGIKRAVSKREGFGVTQHELKPFFESFLFYFFPSDVQHALGDVDPDHFFRVQPLERLKGKIPGAGGYVEQVLRAVGLQREDSPTAPEMVDSKG